ncbi:ABC transporter substrate-binding protein [Paenibacillus silvae]|uniref:ABC transporter substrate-binding protein n=1 Tax=Paenibacillus silvae TaxID=1325358 RepID=UPI003CED329D
MLHTKKYFKVALLLLLISILFLSGCGTGGSTIVTQSDSSADKSEESASDYSISIQNEAGETTIIGEPQKIAVLNWQLADFLLALDIKPYAMTNFMGDTKLEYLEKDALEGVIDLGDKPNLEVLSQSNPDLIIGWESRREIYDQLTKIAPTILTKENDDWRKSLQELGSKLGKNKEAEEWLAKYDQKATASMQLLTSKIDPNETVLYMRVMPKVLRIYGSTQSLGATLSQDIGLQYLPQTEAIQNFENISIEQLPELNPDHIFIQVGRPLRGGDQEAKKIYEELTQSSIWNNMKAMKKKQVYTVPHWIISDAPHIKEKSIDLVLEKLGVN